MRIYLGPYPDDAQEREISIEINDYDTWNVDSTLALVIAAILKKYRDMDKFGIPGRLSQVGGDDNDSQRSFSFYKATYSDSFDKAVDHWNEILYQMWWAFDQYNQDWEDQFYTGQADMISKPVQGHEYSDCVEMVPGPNHTLKFDRVGYEAHRDKIHAGIKLFAEYYENLWD